MGFLWQFLLSSGSYEFSLPINGFHCQLWVFNVLLSINGCFFEIVCINGDDGFLMGWIFMYIVLKGCKPSYSNEPVHFWIAFGLLLIGGSGLDPLGLLTHHWIILVVIDRNAIVTRINEWRFLCTDG